jgi:hypothetical protein
MSDWIYLGDTTPFPTDLNLLVASLLLAFLGGQLLAWVYMYTHTGLSYSRTFVSSLIVLPMTVAMVMMVLDNNLVTAFSLMAVFAIVRFRNIVRDTLDTVYILALIVIGMACGTQKFATAVVGTLLAALVLLYLWYTSFGSRHRYDLILSLTWDGSGGSAALVPSLLVQGLAGLSPGMSGILALLPVLTTTACRARLPSTRRTPATSPSGCATSGDSPLLEYLI